MTTPRSAREGWIAAMNERERALIDEACRLVSENRAIYPRVLGERLTAFADAHPVEKPRCIKTEAGYACSHCGTSLRADSPDYHADAHPNEEPGGMMAANPKFYSEALWERCVGKCIGEECGRLFISKERYDELIAPIIDAYHAHPMAEGQGKNEGVSVAFNLWWTKFSAENPEWHLIGSTYDLLRAVFYAGYDTTPPAQGARVLVDIKMIVRYDTFGRKLIQLVFKDTDEVNEGDTVRVRVTEEPGD